MITIITMITFLIMIIIILIFNDHLNHLYYYNHVIIVMIQKFFKCLIPSLSESWVYLGQWICCHWQNLLWFCWCLSYQTQNWLLEQESTSSIGYWKKISALGPMISSEFSKGFRSTARQNCGLKDFLGGQMPARIFSYFWWDAFLWLSWWPFDRL